MLTFTTYCFRLRSLTASKENNATFPEVREQSAPHSNLVFRLLIKALSYLRIILSISNTRWSFLNLRWSSLNPHWSVSNHHWSILNLRLSSLNPHWSISNLRWSNSNPRWSFLNLRLSNSNPHWNWSINLNSENISIVNS